MGDLHNKVLSATHRHSSKGEDGPCSSLVKGFRNFQNYTKPRHVQFISPLMSVVIKYMVTPCYFTYVDLGDEGDTCPGSPSLNSRLPDAWFEANGPVVSLSRYPCMSITLHL